MIMRESHANKMNDNGIFSMERVTRKQNESLESFLWKNKVKMMICEST